MISAELVKHVSNRMKKLTREQKREIAAVAAKKDADIDPSDMPEVLDWSDGEIGKFYRALLK